MRRFISNFARRFHPFSHFIKKSAPFEWDESCHVAFKKIKKYLCNTSMLGAAISNKPLILYITTQEKSLGASCVQVNEGKEIAMYYYNHKIVNKLNLYYISRNWGTISNICYN